jgi:CCR4-NOT transcription complex subunit 2
MQFRNTDCAYAVSNGTTWAFGGSPMGNAGIATARSNNVPMTSFAQTIGASQTGTPLDLS